MLKADLHKMNVSIQESTWTPENSRSRTGGIWSGYIAKKDKGQVQHWPILCVTGSSVLLLTNLYE